MKIRFFQVAGLILAPAVWIIVKSVFSISDRYLPSISAVFGSALDIEPTLIMHTAYTTSRLAIGCVLGILAGIALGLMTYRSRSLSELLMPTIQALRAVPPIAMVPFFLLWFGFSESGRYLLIILGIGFNIAVAVYQIVSDMPEKYSIMFRGFQLEPRKFTLSFALQRVLEHILPTVRFSLATAVGLVIVSELLGSQVGLGYLIQTSRSTFAMHTIFLATIVLGIVSALSDAFVRFVWRYVVYWESS